MAIVILTADGRTVTSTASVLDGLLARRDAHGRGAMRLTLPQLPLLKGMYSVDAYLMCEQAVHVYDYAMAAARFTVRQPGLEIGLVQVPRRWEAL